MPQHDYLTTREVAALLRVKERKVYDLAASGELPCRRLTGKLLFARAEIEALLAGKAGGAARTAPARPDVLVGSHDPLLEWAARESGSGLATLFDGSLDGLTRYEAHEGLAAGVHVVETEGWNVETVKARFRYRPVVLVEWAWRSRGFIVPAGNPAGIRSLADLAGKRLVRRQPQSGSQLLLERLIAEDDRNLGSRIVDGGLARDEREAALAVLSGGADVAFGLLASARQFRLDFVPVCEERFDLLVGRRDWFDPPLQALLRFCRGEAFQHMAEQLGGYRIDGLGTPHFNGA